jgi:hypothetical protein
MEAHHLVDGLQDGLFVLNTKHEFLGLQVLQILSLVFDDLNGSLGSHLVSTLEFTYWLRLTSHSLTPYH